MRVVEVVSGSGFLLALWSLSSSPQWRAADAAPDRWRLTAVGIAAAWALVAAGDRGAGNVTAAMLIAVASSALSFFAATVWLAPLLLFWGCSSIALAALTGSHNAQGWALTLLAASDVLFVAGALAGRDPLQIWTLGTLDGGLPTALWCLSAALRLWLVARMVARPSTDRAGLPAVPLLLVSVFLLIGGSGQTFPIGVVAAGAALAVAAGIITLVSHDVASVVAWGLGTTVALAVAVPEQPVHAGIAGILCGSAAAVWRETEGRGHFARAFVFGLIPSSAAFAAMSLAYSYGFTALRSGMERRLGLVVLVVTGALALIGAAVAARIARAARSDEWDPLGWLATLAFAFLAAWHGLPAVSGMISLPLGVPLGVGLLQLVTVAAAGIALLLALRRLPGESWPIPSDAPFEFRSQDPRIQIPAVATGVAIVCWGSAVATITWTTVAGLRAGFL